MPGPRSLQVLPQVVYDRRLPLSCYFVGFSDEGLRVQYDSSSNLQDEDRSTCREEPSGRHENSG